MRNGKIEDVPGEQVKVGVSTLELNNLAEANKLGKNGEWEFNEWLDGRSGEPKGAVYQAWSAGAYLYAYECVKRKKVLFF